MSFQTHELRDNYLVGFDPSQYIAKNYEHLLPEDNFVITQAINAIVDLGLKPKSFDKAVDIGNGGVFIAPGLIAPLIKDDGQLILTDVSFPQTHEITKNIRKGRRGHLGIWQKYENIMAKEKMWEGAMGRACELAQSKQVVISDIEPAGFDAASMFYGSESFTSNKEDFETATNKFFDLLKPGGLVIWSAMIGSQGYDTPGSPFSAYWIESQDMLDIADDKLHSVRLGYVSSAGNIRHAYGPKYLGVAVLVGLRR